MRLTLPVGPQDYFRGKQFIPALITELQAKRRPVLISLSPGSNSPNATLARDMHRLAAKMQQPIMARLTGDFWDDWSELSGHFAYAAQLEQFSSPLFSPDLDVRLILSGFRRACRRLADQKVSGCRCCPWAGSRTSVLGRASRG